MRVSHRSPLHAWLLLSALSAALPWACSSTPDETGEWTELTGVAGGGGSGGVPPFTTSSGGGQGGAGGGEGGAGGGEGGAGGACDDTGPGEPNDTEATAVYLGLITDDDDDGGTIQGVLTSAGDVDWYRYDGTDVFPPIVDPTRAFTDPVRVCQFAECIAGGVTDVTCNDGSTAATSPAGRSGCCNNHTFLMEVDCVGDDDDATVYIRVDQPSADCLSYSIDYHY